MKKNKAKEMSSWGEDAWKSAPSTEWAEETSTSNLGTNHVLLYCHVYFLIVSIKVIFQLKYIYRFKCI